MLGARRVGSSGVIAPGLHRQGAVRRWGILGQHHERLTRVAGGVPSFGGSQYFDIVPSRQRLISVLVSYCRKNSLSSLTLTGVL